MKRLFLLDGMALIYRAHFALIQNPIRNSKGVNTSALYGFINTLLAIIEKENPTHLGVAFDTSAPTPRHIRYPAYKAQRDEMPEELAAAIPHVKSLCRAFAIPVLELDGFEADDIIGTLVKRAEPDGFQSFMVTPDKDFAQLLSTSTFIWRPGRKGTDHEIIGLEQLPEIWGVSQPDQIIDLLGLMGDASDNIPGIPGIGPKTAQKLIADFQSIENLIANASQLKGKQKENVEAYADQAILSKELATIITDCPIKTSWHDLTLSQRDDNAIKNLFNEFEFRSLSKRLFGETQSRDDSPSGPSNNPETPEQTPTLFQTYQTIRDIPHAYTLANTRELQNQLFHELSQQPSFCFDLETTSLDRHTANILGIAFSWKPHEGWYLPYSDDILPTLRSLLSAPSQKIGHNLKFDLSILLAHNIKVHGPFLDTMLADALAAPDRRHSMDYLAQTLFNYTPIKLSEIANPQTSIINHQSDDLFAYAETKTTKSKDLDMESIPLEVLAEYAAEDADITLQLSQKISTLLQDAHQEKIYHEIEAPLLPVLVRMEMEGIAIDTAALTHISADLQQTIDQLALTIQQHAGTPFNIASPKQLGQILFEHLKLLDKPKKTKTGQYKTDEQTLSTLLGIHPIIADILEYREATKLKSTYIDALPNHISPATNHIHTHYHQLAASTGRLASSDPNLQNIPIRSQSGRKIRQAFVPRKGYKLLACDYSQIELRIMAALACDPTMISAFQDNADIHTITAAKVHSVAPEEVTREMRSAAKMVNFGIIYGISAFGLSQRLAIPRTEAAEIIDAYFREYPAIKEYMDRTVIEARKKGYAETLSGRRRHYPDLNSANAGLRANAERAAINMPIQGTAADMIKIAMIKIDELLLRKPYQTKMLLQVHDELVFDLHPDEEQELVPKIIHIMETALPLPHDVPILVEHGTGINWLAAH